MTSAESSSLSGRDAGVRWRHLALAALLAVSAPRLGAQDPEPAPEPPPAEVVPAEVVPAEAAPVETDEPDEDARPEERREEEPSDRQDAPSPATGPDRGGPEAGAGGDAREPGRDRERGRERGSERRRDRDRDSGARPERASGGDVAEAAGTPPGAAGTDGRPAAAPLDPTQIASFKVIADRNIFDPKRTRRSASGGPRPPARRDPVVETLGVVGVLDTPRGTFALFDGSSRGHRQTLRVDGEVAGMKVVSISGDVVRLSEGDRTHDVAVGAHLRREDEGAWEVRDGRPGTAPKPSAASGESGADTAAGAASGTGSGAAAGGAGMSDALRRLLQKRQQEMNR